MDTRSSDALEVLRRDQKMVWVVDQVTATFAEGVTEGAKAPGLEIVGTEYRVPADLTVRERAKREKYETSRPYSDEEKVTLLKQAIEAVFVALPAIQETAATGLKELGSDATRIEFLPPDDEERPDAFYEQELIPNRRRNEDLQRRVQKFFGALV